MMTVAHPQGMLHGHRGPPAHHTSVEDMRDPSALDHIRDEWEALREACAVRGDTAGPFLSPVWFAVVAASLVDSTRPLRLLTARRGGTLVGVLPLLHESRLLAGIPTRVLRSLSDDHSQRFDAPILDDAAAAAMLAHLQRAGDWDVLELRDVLDPVNGAGTGIGRLEECARRAGFPIGAWPAMTSPYLRIGGTHAELLGGLSRKFRYNLRHRRERLVAELGPVAFERFSGAAPGLASAMAESFRLEATGWKGEQGTAIACDPLLVARYEGLARAFATCGKLALSFLTVAGRRVASHFALEENGIYYLFKPGYEPALAHYGLGHLLVEEVVRDLAHRGLTELDFLGEDAAWKRCWTSSVRTHSWRYLFRPGAHGRLLHAWKFRVAPQLKWVMKRIGR